jgi:hypothetical protein
MQLALVSSMFYNYTGGIAVTAPPVRPRALRARHAAPLTPARQVSVSGEPVAAPPGEPQAHDMPQLARNVVQAHKRVRPAAVASSFALLTHRRQLDELAGALPPAEAHALQLARIAALRAENEAVGAELEAELERAGALPAPPPARRPAHKQSDSRRLQTRRSRGCATSLPASRMRCCSPARRRPRQHDANERTIFCCLQHPSPPLPTLHAHM